MRCSLRRLAAPMLCLAAASAGAELPSTAPQWSRGDAEALLAYVDAVGGDGLDPADYEPLALRSAIETGDPSAAATRTFLHLADDLGRGHVRASYRIAWHIPAPPTDPAAQQSLLQRALAEHRIAATLSGLAPSHPEYAALKAALAATPDRDRDRRATLRVNLERWRWLPRDLGSRYILVNVPAFELKLVESGKVTELHRLIVGKTRTPTPQFSTIATGVILNPWWDVPDSIIAESVGRLVRTHPRAARANGYVWSGGNIRQAPGPGNSLGQMKLVMPNPYTVYIHDTPSKPLFDAPLRAFSHGCIRVQDPLGLATRLLEGTQGWERANVDRVVASRVSTKVDFAQPIPVFVTYFTAATDASGAMALHRDIYGRDRAVAAGLEDRAAIGAPAAKKVGRLPQLRR